MTRIAVDHVSEKNAKRDNTIVEDDSTMVKRNSTMVKVRRIVALRHSCVVPLPFVLSASCCRASPLHFHHRTVELHYRIVALRVF